VKLQFQVEASSVDVLKEGVRIGGVYRGPARRKGEGGRLQGLIVLVGKGAYVKGSLQIKWKEKIPANRHKR